MLDDHRTLYFRGADSSAAADDASVRLVHRGTWQIDEPVFDAEVQTATQAESIDLGTLHTLWIGVKIGG